MNNKIIVLKNINIKDIYEIYKYKDIEYLKLINCYDTKNTIKKLTNLKYLELIRCNNIKETLFNKKLETLIKYECKYDLNRENRTTYYIAHPKLINLKILKYKFNFDINDKYKCDFIIPKTLINLTNINIQRLNCKNLIIPNTLINLKYIKLTDCVFNEIPKTLINLRSIYIIKCDNFKIYNTLINLHNLYIDRCKNKNQILHKEFINIRKIHFSHVSIKNFDYNFNNFKQLKELIISSIYSLKKNINIEKLTNIKKIYHYCFFGNNKILFPKKLNSLEYLYLGHTIIKFLPQSKNLKILILKHFDDFSFLQNNFYNFKNLHFLKLYNCRNIINNNFSFINLFSYFNLINLQYLYINQCEHLINYIPDYLINLEKLKLVHCFNIKEIPFNSLINLKYVILVGKYNNIKEIPDYITLIKK